MALKRDTYTRPSARVRRRVGGRGGGRKAWRVSARGAASGADLGGSSKYSNENFEDRSGEGFRMKCDAIRVSRS